MCDGDCAVDVPPSSKVQAQLVGPPVLVSVKLTASGTESVVGVAVKLAVGAGPRPADVEHEDRAGHGIRMRPHAGVGAVGDEHLFADDLDRGVEEAETGQADAVPSGQEGPGGHRRPVEALLVVDGQEVTGHVVEVEAEDAGEPRDRERGPNVFVTKS